MASNQKILVCGYGGVGKSALIIRFAQDHFITEYDPTIENSYRKQVVVDDEVRVLELWDQAGREDYSAWHDAWVRMCWSAVTCFALNNAESLAEAKIWLQRLITVRDVEKLDFVILCGCKADLEQERQVSKDQIDAVVQQFGCRYMETSAKTNTGVAEVFQEASRLTEIGRLSSSDKPPKSVRVKPRERCSII